MRGRRRVGGGGGGAGCDEGTGRAERGAPAAADEVGDEGGELGGFLRRRASRSGCGANESNTRVASERCPQSQNIASARWRSPPPHAPPAPHKGAGCTRRASRAATRVRGDGPLTSCESTSTRAESSKWLAAATSDTVEERRSRPAARAIAAKLSLRWAEGHGVRRGGVGPGAT